MRVTVEAINCGTIYQFGGIPELRIYSWTSWITSDGQFVQRGSPPSRTGWYLPVQGEVTGDDIVQIPAFEFDSTDDAPPPYNTTARYSAQLYLNGRMIGFFPTDRFASFWVPAIEELNWDTIAQYNGAVALGQPAPLWLNATQVQAIFDDMMGSRDYMSDTRLGIGATDVPPIDPSWPEVVGSNSPRVAQAVGDGNDVLVAGEMTTVFSAMVLSTSLIRPDGIDDTITGNLRAFNRVPNVSFDVVSDNGADFGAFGWTLRNL